MSEQYRPTRETERATRRIRLAFGLSVLGSAVFAWGYVVDASTQILGTGLAAAFVGIAYGLVAWARFLTPTGGYVEGHPSFSSTPDEQRLLVDAITLPPSPLSRKWLLGLLGTACGALGAAALFPLRSLVAARVRQPVHDLRHTAWAAGALRLVDPDGRPLRVDDITEATITPVYPQGHVGVADSLAFVVRVDRTRLTGRPPGGDVDGVIAYSQLCTHAGCTVALYEQGTGKLLCPCHQSAFDLWSGARPVAGPAGRALPGLPIGVDSEGFLIARGDFTAPPGPGFWSEP